MLLLNVIYVLVAIAMIVLILMQRGTVRRQGLALVLAHRVPYSVPVVLPISSRNRRSGWL